MSSKEIQPLQMQKRCYPNGHRSHYMKKSPEKIIKQYAIINKMHTAAFVSIFTVMPILGILYLVASEGSLWKTILVYVFFSYAGVIVFIEFVMRRCPNCYCGFSKYVFDPAYCPYCNVRLKEPKA